MIIDIIFLLFMIAAIFKGYSRGLILAVFSVIALMVGLAAALKLSAMAAARLKDAVHIAAKWLPLLSFLLVFILALLVVKLVANLLKKSVELIFLGWADRLGGILLYMVLYTVILSVLLFYGDKMNIIPPSVFSSSITYRFIQPWGPKMVSALSWLLPFFKDLFQQLETFFAALADK